MTAAVVVMILVAMTYANTFLDTRMAENEFSTNKQFMLDYRAYSDGSLLKPIRKHKGSIPSSELHS